MQNQQFSEAAARLLDRINNISFKQQITRHHSPNALNQTEPKKVGSTNLYNIGLISPQTQSSLELAKIEKDISLNEQENYKKIKKLNEEIKKIEIYIKEQNEMRVKINENFMFNMNKIQKNLQNSLSNIKKIYHERQKKLQIKIELTIKHEKKQIMQQIEHNTSLQQALNRIKKTVQSLNDELIQMRRSRIQLEDKITKQFNNQITDLKNIFANATKQRDQRELKILQMLKNVYKKHMESIRKEDAQRDANQKMFLTIIEQLIDRIAQG